MIRRVPLESVFLPYDNTDYFYNNLEFDFYVGVDLGQARDYTAIAVIEQPLWVGPEAWQYEFQVFADCIDKTYGGWYLPSTIGPYLTAKTRNINAIHGREPYPKLYLRHIERVPLGTRYPDVIRRVRDLYLKLRGRSREPYSVRLVVDYTGVGRPAVDLLLEHGLQPVPILLTGGSQPVEHDTYITVPVRDLIGSTQRLIEERRLKYPARLPELNRFILEMQTFKRKISLRTGHDSYEAWRESDHDDLVFAVSLCCWMRDADSGAADVACLGFTDPPAEGYEFGMGPGGDAKEE
jgi:hypothetical protein